MLITVVIVLACQLIVYILYKIINRYADHIRYLTFIEDLVLDRRDNLILRLSSDFWFKSFKKRADPKTINLVLRKLGHFIKESGSMESRPYVFGQALGNLSVMNKKCEVRAIRYSSQMVMKTKNAHFIISLMETNRKIEGKHFVKLVRTLPEEAKNELIEFLSNDPSARRLLVLL